MIENTCTASVHPDWDTYSEARKQQCIFADAQASIAARMTLRLIQTCKANYFIANPDEKDEINMHQFMLECVVGILQRHI